MITIVKIGSGNKEQTSINRIIKLWNKLPAEAPANFPCKSHILRKRNRRVIISEEK
jgi:hypothetical protein